MQLLSTLLYNFLAVIEIICISLKYSVLTVKIFQTINDIGFSFLVTYDKEIVIMMVGENARIKFSNIINLDNEHILANKKMTFIEWRNMVGLRIGDEETEETTLERK